VATNTTTNMLAQFKESITGRIVGLKDSVVSTVVSTTTSTTKTIAENLRNIRVEDVTKLFVTDPRSLNTEQTLRDDSQKAKEPNSLSVDDIMITEMQSDERRKMDEYLLSIHSTKQRSRRRLHIRGSEDVVILNRDVIERVEADRHTDTKTTSVVLALKNKDRLSPSSISFSGGGYNCMYHMGVVRYIFRHPELFRDTKYLGASGGAGIIAFLLCFENDPDRHKVLEEIMDFVISLKGRNLRLHKQVDEYSRTLFGYVTEDRFNKYIKDSDRCHISVTDVTYLLPANEVKTKFTSYKQFMETLRATACVPILLDDKIRTIDTKMYLDGGLSNNIPTIDEHTLKISCLNYPTLNADLYPRYQCDIMHCFIPPDKTYIMNMHDQGYSDIERYMEPKFFMLQAIKKEEELNRCITDFIEDPTFSQQLTLESTSGLTSETDVRSVEESNPESESI
ncbi:hypothetical protein YASMINEVIRUS_220, partial [Yasminevirus sp. GU-2018]